MEIEVDVSARPKNQRNERNQRQNAHDPLTLLQTNSDLLITIELYRYVLTRPCEECAGDFDESLYPVTSCASDRGGENGP